MSDGPEWKGTAGEEFRSSAEAQLLVSPSVLQAPRLDMEKAYHELDVLQIELKLQNAELIRSRGEAEEALESYTDLYEFAPIGYFTLGPLGSIYKVNLFGTGLLGLERSRLIGRGFQSFLAKECRATFAAFLKFAFTTPTKVECELSLREAGAAPRRFVHIDAMVTGSGQECRLALTDTTERNQMEDALRDQRSFLHATIDGLSAHVCVLDGEGKIILTNRAWKEFATENQADVATCCEGGNYLGACDNAVADDDSAGIAAVALGIREVSNGTRSQFVGEYTCNSPEAKRWFIVRVTPFGATKAGFVVISHEDITTRRVAEDGVKKYARRLLELEDDLRRRIAGELHDDIAQVLTALGLNLAHVSRQLENEPGNDLSATLENSRALTKDVSRCVRNLMVELHPQQLEDFGLATALRFLGESLARKSGLAVDFQAEACFRRLTGKKERVLFRIAQEALHNVMKHAAATKVTISLGRVDGVTRLAITDDGTGFLPRDTVRLPAGSGWGLTSMRERAELIGGSFSLESVPGKGTMVAVEIKGYTAATREGSGRF